MNKIPNKLPPPKTPVAFDTETTGLNPRESRVSLIQVYWEGLGSIHVIDALVDGGEWAEVRRFLRELAATNPKVVGHNLAFDYAFILQHFGVELFSPESPPFDTMVIEMCLNAGVNAPNKLGDLTQRYLGISLDKSQQVRDWAIRPLPPEAIQYAATDVQYLLPLREKMISRLVDEGLLRAAILTCRVTAPLAKAGVFGVRIDRDTILEDYQLLAEEKTEAEQELTRAIAKELGHGSPDVNLFGEAIPYCKYSSPGQVLALFQKTGAAPEVDSVSESALSPYKTNPVIGEYLRYKHSETAVKDSIKYQKHLTPGGGDGHYFLYPSFKQYGAASGRLSCRQPNIQNIPRSLKRFRECLIARPGHVLICGDFPQIELRIASVYCPEPAMQQAFRDGIDIHRATASLVLGVPLDEVTKEQRQQAKAFNFGLLYGQGVEGFAAFAFEVYGVKFTLSEAGKLRGSFMSAYPGIAAYIKRCRQEVDQFLRGSEPYLESRSLSGRRRLLPREALTPQQVINTPIQGTGVDLLELAAYKFFGADKIPQLLNVVHDELLIEVPEDKGEFYRKKLKESMEAAAAEFLPGIPCPCDVGMAKNWTEAKV